MDAAAPSTSSACSVLAGLAGVRRWQESFYRHLHQNPELSRQEHETARLVAWRLRSFAYEIHAGIGETGVVGILRNGEGPTVLLRADMDALPVREATALPYASVATAIDAAGVEVPVMHACGHDIHVTCLLGAAQLLAEGRQFWSGTLIALFQPAEETADGARRMVDDGLFSIVPMPDVALAQQVLPFPAGRVATRAGPVFTVGESMRITLHGRGAHGSMPHASVDPVVLAALIVVRLQTVVSRETQPGETAVVTVGTIHAGTKSNVIPDTAVLELNIRSYSVETRAVLLNAIRRIVVAECQASGAPKDPEFELYDGFPLTQNDAATTGLVAAAFAMFFGPSAEVLTPQTASEDFSNIPDVLDVPYTYWGFGGIEPRIYQLAEQQGCVSSNIPVNHSAHFAPVIQPTLDTGTCALVVAALVWLGH